MNQEGRGVAVIRSLRGGTSSVVEALSLRIRAECPPPYPPPKIEEGPPREHLHGQAHTTHIHTQVRDRVRECDLWLSEILPAIAQINRKDSRKSLYVADCSHGCNQST